jgi:protein-S-isoprenylcysteine O-methyltransferase Ste14
MSMKGLYVYGALVMALSFAAGLYSGDRTLMSVSLAAALLAAASEAGQEIYSETDLAWVRHPSIFLAFASWAATAFAALSAICVLLGA